MSEELTDYYSQMGLRVRYMHSDMDTMQRTQLIREFRMNLHDVLIGINLLREGLDLPEVSLVAILDADKEGFLRSKTSLIQTIGRAARNVNGRVILFAKRVTKSMQFAIDLTNKRRKVQIEYNEKNNIVPKNVTRRLDNDLKINDYKNQDISTKNKEKMPAKERAKIVKKLTINMIQASKDLNFEEAIRLRDEITKARQL
jgi:excinuclease ABC subunit B